MKATKLIALAALLAIASMPSMAAGTARGPAPSISVSSGGMKPPVFNTPGGLPPGQDPRFWPRCARTGCGPIVPTPPPPCAATSSCPPIIGAETGPPSIPAFSPPLIPGH